MFTKLLGKLLNQTNIHGTEQTTNPNPRICQIFWLIVVLGLTSFSIYQIVNLTKQYVSGETVTSNKYLNIPDWEQIDKHFRLSYCAADWMNLSLIEENEASALAIIAAADMLGEINFNSFSLLKSRMTEDEIAYITDETVTTTFKTFAYADLYYDKELVFDNYVKTEMEIQSVNTALELLRKFSKKSSENETLIYRFGCICEVMHKQKNIKPSTNNYISYDINFEMEMDEEIDEKIAKSGPFVIAVEPVNIAIDSAFPDPMLFRSGPSFEDPNLNYNYVRIAYTTSLNIKEFHYLKKNEDCQIRQHMKYNVASLKSICEFACESNDDVDVSILEDIQKFYNATKFENALLLQDLDAIAKCKMEHCSEIVRSCTELNIQVKPIMKEVLEASNVPDEDVWERERQIEISIENFLVIVEQESITFESYIGSVGGSLGVCIGASMVSLLQLCINCLTVCKKPDDADKDVND